VHEPERHLGRRAVGQVRQTGLEGRHHVAAAGIADAAEPLGVAMHTERPPSLGQRSEVRARVTVKLLQRVSSARYRARPDDGGGRDGQKAGACQLGSRRIVFAVQEAVEVTDAIRLVPQ
jgi:hypothetical protein